MTDGTLQSLKALQGIDAKISEDRKRVTEFDPILEELDEPVLRMESDVGKASARLQEMKLDERRIELSAEGKRSRLTKLQDRLNSVRNLREEAAVHAEADMLRRALETDDSEALQLLDQIKKSGASVAEMEAELAEAQAELGPKREGILKERAGIQSEVAELDDRRREFAGTIGDRALRVYEQLKSGGRSVVVADMTQDGACSHCYGMVPLQRQNEIRHNVSTLFQCEACGVILTPPSDEPEEPVAAAADEDPEAPVEPEDPVESEEPVAVAEPVVADEPEEPKE